MPVQGVVWEVQTGGNVANGGGFKPANANGITDLATTTGTSATPDVSSATYTFVAGDVDDWVYISAGTDWIVGYYKITAVNAGVATLDAAVGKVLHRDSLGNWRLNTVAGCATASTPSGNATCSVDYSQSTVNTIGSANLENAVASGTTLTCNGGTPFTPAMVGNVIKLSGTNFSTTTPWYVITAFGSTSSVTIDRAAHNGSNATAGTGKLGGPLASVNRVGSDPVHPMIGLSECWIKAGTYTSGALSSYGDMAVTTPSFIYGYNTTRYDNPVGDNRPLLYFGTASHIPMVPGEYKSWFNLRFETDVSTGNNILDPSSSFSLWFNCKIKHALGSGDCFTSASGAILIACELQSLGDCLNPISLAIGCYIHDGVTGIKVQSTSNAAVFIDCVFDSCTEGIVSTTGDSLFAIGCTFINCISAIAGDSGAERAIAWNCIFHSNYYDGDWSTAQIGSNVIGQSLMFNRYLGVNSSIQELFLTTADPGWAATVLTDTNGATDVAGTGFTASGYNFQTLGVTSADVVVIKEGGTGATVGVHRISSVSGTTITLASSAGASKTGITWGIVVGTPDLSPGTNAKAMAWPSYHPGRAAAVALTGTSYKDLGAIQRQEPAGTGTTIVCLTE